jgi:hypothetical protein
MSKDKKTDYSKLTLGAKIPVKKVEAEPIEVAPVFIAPRVEKVEKTAKMKVDKAVSVIHAAPKIMKPMKTDERTLRVTLDIPLSLHAQIRTQTFQKGISMKEYFLELAKKEMGLA